MRRIRSACCARAASGHAAAAPPSSVMNSRRLIRSPRRRGASSVGGTVRPSALAVLRLMTSSNLVGLLDRQVGRLLALENPAGIDADLTIRIRNAGCRSSSGRRPRRTRATGRSRAPRGGPPARRADRVRLVKNGSAPITSAPARSSTSAAKAASKSRSAAGLQDMKLQPERAGRRLHVSRLRSRHWDWSG